MHHLSRPCYLHKVSAKSQYLFPLPDFINKVNMLIRRGAGVISVTMKWFFPLGSCSLWGRWVPGQRAWSQRKASLPLCRPGWVGMEDLPPAFKGLGRADTAAAPRAGRAPSPMLEERLGGPLGQSLDRFLREPTWRRPLPAAGKAREPRRWRHASARITWRRAGVTRAASPAGERRPQPEGTGEGPGGAGGEVAALRGPPRALGGAYRPAELR